MGGEVSGLSSGNFGGVEGNCSGYSRDSDGGGGSQHSGGGLNNRSYGSSGGGGADRQVSSCDTEAINGVRDVAGALD
jgi:hypothetical protein